MLDEKTIQMIVKGLVQGVGFRWATRQAARRHNIAGYVQNLYRGDVKIIAQGRPADLKIFEQIIKRSPTPYGHVKAVEIRVIPRVPYSLFIVK